MGNTNPPRIIVSSVSSALKMNTINLKSRDIKTNEYLHFTSLKPGQRLPAVPETTFVHFFHFHASVSIQHWNL